MFISFVRFIFASLCLQTFCLYCKDPAFISSLLTIPALVLSALVLSALVLSALVLSALVLSALVLSALVLSALVLSALVLSALVSSVPHHLCLPFIFASLSLRSFYISFIILAFGLFWLHYL